ncbi:MAG TPA: hypothetical protein VFX16_19600 [Pseudonocardiaceae bacterium]|nr:hypothetical protein [Pseudonocardiaceae bacterium]
MRQAIAETPLLGAPPRLSRRGASAGLALLETALTLGHVRRLTERLQVAEYRNSRRVTEIDVSLELLDRGQRQALSTLAPPPNPDPDGGESEPMLWLPIARVSGRTAVPIEVRGAAGNRLATMTQYETSRLLASGMYQLFRGILSSHEDAKDLGGDLSAFLFRIHEPRWLVQQAILTLLTERNKPGHPDTHEPTPNTVPGVNRQYRDMAFHILDKYESALADYFDLLTIAANDYFLVAAFDQSVNEHFLSYVSPLHTDRRPPVFTELTRRLLSARNGYYIRYTSTIPANLRSYHLVAETLDGLDIKTMFLRTDVDRESTLSISADLTATATELRQLARNETLQAKKVLELEVQNVLRRLNDLWRRRRWDAGDANADAFEDLMPACGDLVHAITSGEAVQRRPSGETDNSLVRHPLVTPENLYRAAREVVEHDLQYDISFERDPVGRQAHAYWRRPTGRQSIADQIEIVASILIVDSTTSGPRTVRSYALAVSLITYIVASLLDGFPFPFGIPSRPLSNHGSPDAMVTVLLLLPGFLYSRLSLPTRRSIAGYMQVLPRLVSHGSIFLVAALAAAVAANASNTVLVVFFGMAIVLPVVATILLRDPPSGRSLTESISALGGPKWVRPTGLKPIRRQRKPDETLSSSRS